MNADEFASQLKAAGPKKEDLIRFGYPEDLAEFIEISSVAERIPGASSPFTDPLLEFVTLFDVSNVVIGLLTFEPVAELRDYYYVGRYDVDYLVVRKRDGVVCILQYDADFVISNCALNSSMFLDTMVAYAQAKQWGLDDPDAEADQLQKKQLAEHCAALAGGDAFLSFYKNFIGYYR